jgi:hypothetical protein
LDFSYLLKNGKVVNAGIVYRTPIGADCEREGFARFIAPKKWPEKVGLLDNKGKVVIPAIYDELGPVRNGMLMANYNPKNLRRHYPEMMALEEHVIKPFCHIDTGTNLLLNTRGDVLVKNIDCYGLDFHSVLIESAPSTDPIRLSYLAKDGTYYSFIDQLAEFEKWLTTLAQSEPTKDVLLRHSYDTITWRTHEHSVKLNKTEFIDVYYDLLQRLFQEIAKAERPYFRESWLDDCEGVEQFCTLCGGHMLEVYPLMQVNVAIPQGEQSDSYILKFIRTDKGYRLLMLNKYS